MATTPALIARPGGNSAAGGRNPANRHDLLWNGPDLREYIRLNAEHLRSNSPYLTEAALILYRELRKVPPDGRFSGKGSSVFNFADHRIALRKMRDHLKTAAALMNESAAHVRAAWAVYLGVYGDPDAPKIKSGRFDPHPKHKG